MPQHPAVVASTEHPSPGRETFFQKPPLSLFSSSSSSFLRFLVVSSLAVSVPSASSTAAAPSPAVPEHRSDVSASEPTRAPGPRAPRARSVPLT